MRELLARLIQSSGATKKYRRRIRRVVRQLGLEDLLEDPQQAETTEG